MSHAFDPNDAGIVVHCEVFGPINRSVALLSLDTGATMTILTERFLRSLGFDPAAATVRRQLTTASGHETAVELALPQFDALGRSRFNFPVICMDLPAMAAVDGLLGLDFFRGLTLTLDFRAGQITLA